MIPINGRRSLGDIFDTLDTVLSKGTDLYNQNSALLDPLRNSAIKSLTQSATSSVAPQNTGVVNQNNVAPPATSPMSTGLKVAIAAGGAVVLGTAGYLIFAKEKKKAAA